MLGSLSGLFSTKQSHRLRAIGTLVLILGLAAALVFYVVALSRPAGDNLAELLPGYARMEERQMRIQMGTLGVLMLEWQAALATPGVQAIIIAVVAAIVGGCFFRVAWVLDENERDQLPSAAADPRSEITSRR